MFGFKRVYSQNGGAVSGTVVSVLTALAVVTAVTVLGAAKLSQSSRTAYMYENGTVREITTSAATAEAFAAEIRSGLHPYDRISYLGVTEAGEYEISIEHAPYVTIAVDGSERSERAIRGETVAELLTRENVSVGEYDAVFPSVDSQIYDDCAITVTRAFPVKIAADGEEKTVLAAGMTVGELLVRENYSLCADDELNADTDTQIYSGMKIQITRVEYVTREKSQFIAYETEYTDSPLLKTGDTEVLTKGVDGNITITIRDKYVNGVKLSSEVIDTKKTAPVNEVIACGTAMNDPISKREGNFTLKNGIPTEYEFVLEGKVTAYTAPAGSGTYSGRPLVIGSIGVDPDVIPFGSEVYIVSKDGTHVYGYAIASDTGDIKGSGVLADAYMGTTADNYGDACKWGAQFCYVYVLSVGDNSVSWR